MRTPRRFGTGFLALLCLGVGTVSGLQQETTSVGVASSVAGDRRLQPLKDLDGYFPMEVPRDASAWAGRSARLRERLLVSMGLWPMPTRTPLKPVIHGRMDLEGYSVEKVFFEAVPGFFVTGSLYRPLGRPGPFPGVLSPHGHWPAGRFMDAGEGVARQEVASGAEEDLEAARSPLQARCVQLARLGCVVFHYDMIGYADSVQISLDLAHGFRQQRPEMNRAEGWGLFSPQAENHLMSVMGLQTWSSIRALDFLEGLPDVDATRLACTGASGGGTQTFILGALDERVRATYPAVMVSTAMQGGCTCENASLLRVGMGNIDLAALFAPRPMALSTANDWTREMATRGFPELQAIYRMTGAPDHVHLHRGEQYGHNFNLPSRQAMYRWFNTHLGLGAAEPDRERPFRRLTADDLTVWDEQHPRPEAGNPDMERRLMRWWTSESHRLLESSHATWDWLEAMVRPAWNVVLGADLLSSRPVWQWDLVDKEPVAGIVGALRMSGHLRSVGEGTVSPVTFLYPGDWKGPVVVWLTADGRSGLQSPGGRMRPEVARLLEAGTAVMGIDLLHQGEFLPDGGRMTRTPKVANPRESAAYTLGYNPSVWVERVHDVVRALRYLRQHEKSPTRVSLVALDETSTVALAARLLAGDAVDRCVVDTGGRRLADVQDIRDPDLAPGAAKYGDVPLLMALGKPRPMWVAGESEDVLQWVHRFHREQGAGDALMPGVSGESGAWVKWVLAD